MKNKEKRYNLKHVFDTDGKFLPVSLRTYITNEGYNAIAINSGSKRGKITIQIDKYIAEVDISALRKGSIKNPFHTSVLEIGYLGVGQYNKDLSTKSSKVY